MDDVRYQSGDPAALGPDERVVFEREFAPSANHSRTWRSIAARIASVVLATALFVCLVQYSLPERRTSDLATVVLVAIGLVCCGLVLRDPLVKRVGPTSVRFTNERVLNRGPKKFAQVEVAEIRSVAIRDHADGGRTIDLAHVHLESGEVTFDGPPPLVTIDAALPAIIGVIRLALVRGLETRQAARREKQKWRPAGPLGTSASVPLGDPEILATLWLTPLDGEAALWAGRPTRSWRAACRRRWRSFRKAAPWAIAAGIAVASPFLVSWRGRAPLVPGAVIAAVIGALVLLAIFMNQVVEPRRRWRVLGETSYVLTNRRIITRIGGGRAMHETSQFFDDMTHVELQADPDVDGVGSVTIWYSHAFESIADAAEVYALAVRAVAGARLGAEPAASPALPVTPPVV